MFILRERERARASAHEQGRGREQRRERIPSRLCTVSTQPDTGLGLTTREIMTWVKTKSRTLNWLSHPGTPTSVDPHTTEAGEQCGFWSQTDTVLSFCSTMCRMSQLVKFSDRGSPTIKWELTHKQRTSVMRMLLGKKFCSPVPSFPLKSGSHLHLCAPHLHWEGGMTHWDLTRLQTELLLRSWKSSHLPFHWGYFRPSRNWGQKTCIYPWLLPVSHGPHLRCQKVCLALLSTFISNTTASHCLYHYNLSLRWNIFGRLPTGLTASTVVLQQSIVYRAARVIF